jgi:hypothetical protein
VGHSQGLAAATADHGPWSCKSSSHPPSPHPTSWPLAEAPAFASPWLSRSDTLHCTQVLQPGLQGLLQLIGVPAGSLAKHYFTFFTMRNHSVFLLCSFAKPVKSLCAAALTILAQAEGQPGRRARKACHQQNLSSS